MIIIFFQKKNKSFNSKKGFFAHVTNFEIKAVQVKNTSVKSITISKNFKIEHLRDYSKKKCFLTTSKNRHLAVVSEQKFDLKQTLKKSVINKPKMKTVLSNDITMYENKNTIQKLTVITKKTSQI